MAQNMIGLSLLSRSFHFASSTVGLAAPGARSAPWIVKTTAGRTGFSVAHLRIPGFVQPWEATIGKPDRIVSALDIMLEGPLGGAAFNNEFGRPNICGYFRSFEAAAAGDVHNRTR